jgi:ribonuclease D
LNLDMTETLNPNDGPGVIDDDQALGRLFKRLKGKKRLAIDTEAASYHRYFDRIYLVQVSSDSETAIIDPLSVLSLDPLGAILADPKIEVVFHDADYDLRVLDRDYRYHAKRVFDTRIAAQLLGEPAVGLAALLEKYYGIQVNKKFQRADWSRRPLPDDMIAYAASDTNHLLRLRDELETQLQAANRLDWAREEFERLEGVRWTTVANGEAYLRVKGAKALPARQLAVLKEVYAWRDARAKEADRAPFRILGNDAMLALAKAAPATRAALNRVRGLPPSAARRYGDELLEAVGRGLATPPKEYPRIERGRRPKINRAAEAVLEHLKSLRNRRARALGVEAGVLCANGTLQAIARLAPKTSEELLAIEDIRRWQLEALGVDEVLAQTAGKSGTKKGKTATETR